MSMRDAMREHNEAVQPVLDAIDTAMRSGKVDTASLSEAIDGHLDWWQDELYAQREHDA